MPDWLGPRSLRLFNCQAEEAGGETTGRTSSYRDTLRLRVHRNAADTTRRLCFKFGAHTSLGLFWDLWNFHHLYYNIPPYGIGN